MEFGGDRDRRPFWSAVRRGADGRCPQCGGGALFLRYLKVAPRCDRCGLDLEGHRADDAPPYATLFVVGHVTIPGALFAERFLDPPLWAQFVVWTVILIAGSLWFLPISKGALIGVQWSNKMHGFDPDGDSEADVGRAHT